MSFKIIFTITNECVQFKKKKYIQLLSYAKFYEKRRLLFSTTDPLPRIGTPTPHTRTAQPHPPAREK